MESVEMISLLYLPRTFRAKELVIVFMTLSLSNQSKTIKSLSLSLTLSIASQLILTEIAKRFEMEATGRVGVLVFYFTYKNDVESFYVVLDLS